MSLKQFITPCFVAILLLQTITANSQSGLITNITASSGHSYTLGTLITGATIYSDRTYQATTVPAFLNNATFIMTPNDDKANKATSSPTFNLTQGATVYIGYDPRATVLPAWLSSWQKLATQVGINDPNISGLILYSKTFASGTVTLGGNLASPAAGALNMYLIIAVAQASQYTLTVATSGNGTVTKNPDQVNYDAGASVTLTATPAAGQQFTGWSGDATGTVNPLTISMDANKSIAATFAPISSQYTLTVATSGSGTVTKNPDQANYNNGTTVTLTAAPATGQQFTGWSGDATGTVNPLTITMDANKSLTATYAPIATQYTLTVTASGSGTVTKNPDQANYNGGTTVTLTATPATGQQFTGWSGDATGMVNPLSAIMNSNKNITAGFSPAATALVTNIASTTANTYTLGELIVGSSLFTDRTYQATAVPSFLNHASLIETPNNDKGSKATSLLSFTVTQRATVYVAYDTRATAIPAWLSTFQKLASQVGINDPGTSLVNLYSKTFNAGRISLGGNLASPAAGALDNYFVIVATPSALFNLTVTASGSGAIAKNPDQVSYSGGTGVTLTATPVSGQQFIGWGGDANGSVNPLTIAMDASKSITGTFAPVSNQFILTTNINGKRLGNKNPDQPNYASGTNVSLSAVPAAGQQFSGWSGDASGIANPLTIVMTANKSVTATFAPLPPQYTLAVITNGNGTVTKNPDQASYTSGSSVDLTATPATGQQFSGWTGSVTSTVNPLTITMDANKSITASFATAAPVPSISTYPLSIYDNDVSGGAAGINRAVTIKNSGGGVLSVSSITLTGTNANQFILSGLPVFPRNFNTGDSVSFSVAFNPTSKGLKIAAININSNDSTNASLAIPMRALGTAGLGGTNEPSLQSLLTLLQIQATVGDDNVNTTVINSDSSLQKAPLLGDEVSVQQFKKAGPGNVTITPLGVFGPTGNDPVLGFGWYKSGDASSKSELLTVSNTPLSNGQTVNVNYTGTLSFDPASNNFGFYCRWPFFNNRLMFSEDVLNTFAGAIPHHVRVYPYKKNGLLISNSYLVTFEDNTSGLDYNDLIFLVSNVKKFIAPTVVTALPDADAYVRNGTFATTNFGTDTSLVVKSSSIANTTSNSYFKFSLPAVPKIKTAKVRLYGFNKDNTSTLALPLFGLDDDSWTETGITFNNAPTPSSPSLVTVGINNVAQYYEYDVTDFVKAQYAGDKVVSFLLKDTANKNITLSFNSKENGQNPPQLIIDTSTSNASMFVQNMDSFPSNDHVVFSHVYLPWTRDSVYNDNHDSVKVRIHNNGINPLFINNLTISVDSLWKIDKLSGTDYNPLTQLPAIINSGGFLDLMVKFTPQRIGNSATRAKLLHQTLTISSNDDKAPEKKIFLDGLWQYSGEGDHEPYSQEILATFGFKTQTGFGGVDPDLGDSTKLKGDEIKPDFFLRADTTTSITIRQIAAYHGCCHLQEYFKWFDRGAKVYNTVFLQIGVDGQSLLPRRSLSGTPSAGTFIPSTTTTPFGVMIGDGNTTIPSINTSKQLGVRVYKAFDGAGNIIQNAYILANDYLGPESNHDYNDNMYYVTNIKPYTGTVYYSPLNVTPSDLDFGEQVLQKNDSMLLNISSGGKAYSDGSQDPALVISSVVITGENKAEFSADMPLISSLNPQQATTIKVRFNPISQGLKIADMLIYYNNSQSPKRVPLYGIAKATGVIVTANYRVNSGASSPITINGKTWAADNQYSFDNLEPYKNPALKQIAGTDEDALYLQEQSSNADKKPFRYQFPVANGTYYVRLHFAEIYWGAPGAGLTGGVGSRTFSVNLENESNLINYDLTGDVGGATAVIKNFIVTVTDGNLNINFSATVNRPLVSAVEVYSFSAAAQRPATIAAAQNPLALLPNKPALALEKPGLYPNPVYNKNFNIEFPANYQGVYNLQLIDILGKKYNLGQTRLNKGGSNMNVDISRLLLKPGVYFLKINSDASKADVLKLLIQ